MKNNAAYRVKKCVTFQSISAQPDRIRKLSSITEHFFEKILWGLSGTELRLPLVKDFLWGGIAKNFAVHPIHGIGSGITIPLSTVTETLPLGEETADDTISVLVGATLVTAIWVTVIYFLRQIFQALIVLKLRTIINGDRSEGPGWKMTGGF